MTLAASVCREKEKKVQLKCHSEWCTSTSTSTSTSSSLYSLTRINNITSVAAWLLFDVEVWIFFFYLYVCVCAHHIYKRAESFTTCCGSRIQTTASSADMFVFFSLDFLDVLTCPPILMYFCEDGTNQSATIFLWSICKRVANSLLNWEMLSLLLHVCFSSNPIKSSWID